MLPIALYFGVASSHLSTTRLRLPLSVQYRQCQPFNATFNRIPEPYKKSTMRPGRPNSLLSSCTDRNDAAVVLTR